MTEQPLPRLSFAQRRQRRKARQASNLAFINRPSAARDKRAAKWKADAAERRRSRRELDGEARELAERFRTSGFSEEVRDDRRDANRRALLARGLDSRWISVNELDAVAWDNPALVSLLRKWDRLAAKGLTRYQIETELERRLNVVQSERMDNENHQRLLDLVREYYGTDLKGRHRRVSHLRSAMRPVRRRAA